MRIQSLLALSLALSLFSTSCTKDDQFPSTTAVPAVPPADQGIVFSDWTPAAQLMWSIDEAGATPARRATWEAPALTENMIRNGSVLIYARSAPGAEVQAMPAFYNDENIAGEADHFGASAVPGSFQVTHSRFANGIYTVPSSINVSFRYIMITDDAPPVNGRSRTFADLQALTYEEVITELGIPE